MGFPESKLTLFFIFLPATGFIGMWHDPSHLAERSHCLNRLAEIYGRLPLVYSDILMMPMYTEAMRCPN